MLDCTDESLFLIFERAFANTVDSLVGIHLHEHPIRAKAIYDEGFGIRDFHIHLHF